MLAGFVEDGHWDVVHPHHLLQTLQAPGAELPEVDLGEVRHAQLLHVGVVDAFPLFLSGKHREGLQVGVAGASLAGRAPRNKRRLRPMAGVVPSHLRRWYPEVSGVTASHGAEWAQPLAGLAQQVEQLPCKHQVVGSNPSAGTR